MNINTAININSFPFSFLIKTSIPVSIACVVFTTFRNAPKTSINIAMSIASAKPRIGDNNVLYNVALTTPLPSTISSPTNLASGKNCVIV